MKIHYLSKNYVVSDKLKDIIEKKVNKLDKFFDADTTVKVLCKQIKDDIHVLELTVMVDNGVLRAEVTSDNMYNNIDVALPKLEKQIIKHHQKIASKSKKFRVKELSEDSEKTDAAAMAEKAGVVRSKSYALTPMTVDDAVEELELVGHDFFVFLNKATNNINVLYKRVDENYGLIETTI